MPTGTFMLPNTLHALTDIHALCYITCEGIHSCPEAHYMSALTFMPWVTLHVGSYIHATGHITWQNKHS